MWQIHEARDSQRFTTIFVPFTEHGEPSPWAVGPPYAAASIVQPSDIALPPTAIPILHPGWSVRRAAHPWVDMDRSI
jgi:hypothetical protein